MGQNLGQIQKLKINLAKKLRKTKIIRWNQAIPADFWSVRPIEIFAEIHDFQGFAGLHPLFFGVFAAMAVDFPPEGQF